MDRFKRVVDGVRKIEFSRRTLFYALAVLMMALVGGVIIVMATFLANRLNTALTVDPNIAPHTQFDIAGFEKLQLTK